jgi:hypothetical protein
MWNDYVRLSSIGEHYAALLRTAEIYGCRAHLDLKTVSKYTSIVIDPSVLPSVQEEIERHEQKIIRVLSVGDTWNVEELLWVITLKIQIDMLLAFLAMKGYKVSSRQTETSLKAIREVGLSSRNRQAYDEATKLIRKNWGLPIEHELLAS